MHGSVFRSRFPKAGKIPDLPDRPVDTAVLRNGLGKNVHIYNWRRARALRWTYSVSPVNVRVLGASFSCAPFQRRCRLLHTPRCSLARLPRK